MATGLCLTADSFGLEEDRLGAAVASGISVTFVGIAAAPALVP
jgi:hypothetical protein